MALADALPLPARVSNNHTSEIHCPQAELPRMPLHCADVPRASSVTSSRPRSQDGALATQELLDCVDSIG
jgi:hypothetical protein